MKDSEYVATLTRENAAPRYNVLVMSTDSKPLPNLPVRVFIEKKEEKPLQTDAQGRLEVPSYGQRRDITLLCQTPDLGWGVTSMQSSQDGSYVLTLHKPGSPRQLRLVSFQGKPVPKSSITLTSLEDRHSSESNGGGRQDSMYNLPDSVRKELGLVQVTDANGMVTFPLVDARLAGNLRIQSTEFGNQQKSFQEDGSAFGDDIRIQKRAKVTGKLIIPPAAGTRPEQYNVIAQSAMSEVTTGIRQDGAFAFEMEPGEYKFSGAFQGGASRYLVRSTPVLKLASGETKIIDLEVKKGIPVRGKYLPKDGKMPNPLPRLGLQIEENRGSNPKPVSADGFFEFFVPAPGEYQLFVEIKGQPNSYRNETIKVPGEQAVENLEIRGE